MKTVRPGQQIKMASVDELLCVPQEEATIELKISMIDSFQDHPFHVLDDERMDELVNSIRLNGILTPVLVRPKGFNRYEMISGHRRMHAAQIAGLDKVPAVIREMSDDDAVINMVDGNIQREELLPSEKAFAYKMKLDAMRHQGTCRHDVDKSAGIKSCEMVGETGGVSGRQVQRYIRLTDLIPEILELVDRKRLPLMLGVEASYIHQDIQEWLFEYIRDNGFIKIEQIKALREYQDKHSAVTQEKVIRVLNEALPVKQEPKKVVLSEAKIRKYFPPTYSIQDMERVMIGLLEQWQGKGGEIV